MELASAVWMVPALAEAGRCERLGSPCTELASAVWLVPALAEAGRRERLGAHAEGGRGGRALGAPVLTAEAGRLLEEAHGGGD